MGDVNIGSTADGGGVAGAVFFLGAVVPGLGLRPCGGQLVVNMIV